MLPVLPECSVEIGDTVQQRDDGLAPEHKPLLAELMRGLHNPRRQHESRRWEARAGDTVRDTVPTIYTKGPI